MTSSCFYTIISRTNTGPPSGNGAEGEKRPGQRSVRNDARPAQPRWLGPLSSPETSQGEPSRASPSAFSMAGLLLHLALPANPACFVAISTSEKRPAAYFVHFKEPRSFHSVGTAGSMHQHCISSSKNMSINKCTVLLHEPLRVRPYAQNRDLRCGE